MVDNTILIWAKYGNLIIILSITFEHTRCCCKSDILSITTFACTSKQNKYIFLIN